MRVFVLNTGRCGSYTLYKACGHIDNYTCGHESNWGQVNNRPIYRNNHIEIDNRLVWYLGRLDKLYDKNATIYIHLKRNVKDTANSLAKRTDYGIIKAYTEGIATMEEGTDPYHAAMDYILTVRHNIDYFLKDKPNKLTINLENFEADFLNFWQLIGATGAYDKAISELKVKHNASK